MLQVRVLPDAPTLINGWPPPPNSWEQSSFSSLSPFGGFVLSGLGKTVGPGKKINAVQTKSKTMNKQFFKFIGAAALALALVTGGQAGSTKGSASSIPAYYDGKLFTIQFVEFSPAAERTILQHNKSLNFIYQSDPGLPGGQPFISV